jgi:5-methylcytosine-specific restriction endonuclease McrA
MNNRLEELLERFKHLEDELLVEIKRKEKKFQYEIRDQKVHFQAAVSRHHHTLAKKLEHYLRDAKLTSFLTTPAILSCIIPVTLMDFWATAYQFICFPAYGIPKVRRRDYIILDRHKLRYLNSIERLNCAYCGYVNGAIAYVQEIAGRTEQHWCPIKHAVRLKTMHSRYSRFLDYGDAEAYRQRIEKIRRDFEDLKAEAPVTPASEKETVP